MRQRPQPIEPPRIIPAHNLFGDHGPLCPWCSGLGHVLRLGSEGSPTRSTSRCTCKGTGVDLEAVRETHIATLTERITALERQLSGSNQLKAPRITSRTTGVPKLSRQFWMELIAWATASGASINTSVAETIIFPNVTVPANYMQDGRQLRLRYNGQHSTLGSGTVTITFFVRWGGVAGVLICKSAAITQLISLTAAYWDVDVVLQTRSNGSAGTLMGNGLARVFGATAPTIGSATGAPAVAPLTNGGQITPAVATCDFTADTALSVTAQLGASSASNICIGNQYGLESMN